MTGKNEPSEKKSRPEMGKWSLWRFFNQVAVLKPHMPQTAILTPDSLRNFLNRYQRVYVKPSGGWGGKHIVKAWKTSKGYAFVAETGSVQTVASVQELFSKVRLSRAGMLYIVQQAIDLAEISKRPFDIRLMMVRNPKKTWDYAVMLAKVAGPSSIVTNIRRGKGYVLEVEEALKRSLNWDTARIERCKRDMIKIGYQVAGKFDQYNLYWNLGIDLAVDKNGKIWIIEENTAPNHSMFAMLKNQTHYRKLQRMSAAYFRSLRNVK